MRWLDGIIKSMEMNFGKLGYSEGQGSLAQESAWSINVLQGLSKLVYRKCNVLAFSLPRPFKHHDDNYLFIYSFTQRQGESKFVV